MSTEQQNSKPDRRHFGFEIFNKPILTGAIMVLSVLLIVQSYLFLVYYSVNSNDVSYYLQYSRFFANGLDIYGETPAQYNPLATIFLSLPYWIINDPPFIFFQLIQLVFIILCGLIFYFILIRTGNSPLNAVFFSLLVLLAVLNTDTLSIGLGSYMLLFLLLTVLALFSRSKYRYANAGLWAFLAFWCKQYALFILPVLLIAIFIEYQNNKEHRKRTVNSLLQLIIGFFVPVFLSIIFLLFTNNASLHHILQVYSGTYNNNDVLATGYGSTVSGLLKQITKQFLQWAPFFIVILILIFSKTREYGYIIKNRLFILFLALFIAPLSMLKFAYYDHYFSIIIPFAILLAVFLIKNYKTENNSTFSANLLSTSFFIPILFGIVYCSSHIYHIGSIEKRKQDIYETGRLINKVVPPYSPAIIDGDGDAFLIFICKLNPANKKSLHSNANVYSSSTILRNIVPSGFILIRDDQLKRYIKKINLYNETGKHQFLFVDQIKNYKIIKKIN